MVFKNAQVLTMLDGPSYRAEPLLVRAGKFVSGKPADDAVVHDLTGKYVVPGLVELHAHLPTASDGDSSYQNDVLFLWVANGVTRARSMLGHSSHLPLRAALARNELLGPVLMLSGPSFSGGSVRDVDQAVQRVRTQKAAGYDFLKIHPGLAEDEFAAMAAVAQEEGIGFSGHVTESVGLFASLQAGQRTIDHLDGMIETLVSAERLRNRAPSWFGADLAMYADAAKIEPLLAALKASGAALVPTETLLENVAGDVEELRARAEFAYLPANLRQRYVATVANQTFNPESARTFLNLRKELIGRAFHAGVPVLLGSDAPQIFNVPGFSLHRELASMVAAGLTPYEAIASGSVAAARFYDAEASWGVLAPGRTADFIVLDADPLADIGNIGAIDAVMLRGRYLDRAELDAGLADIRARYR